MGDRVKELIISDINGEKNIFVDGFVRIQQDDKGALNLIWKGNEE